MGAKIVKQKFAITWVLAGIAVWPAVPAAAQMATDSTGGMKMQKAVDYPRAGIILAVPTGFTISPQLWAEYQVMLASRTEGMQAAQSISLEVYPADEKITPEQVLERLRVPLQDSLPVQRLSVVKTVTVPVAGLEGKAVHMSYTFRGIKTVTVSLCFLRDISSAVPAATPAGDTQPVPKRLAYVLTLEVAEDYQKTLLKTFDAVIRTIFLTAVRRPIDLPVDFDGPYLRNFPQGYAARLPVGWIGGQNDLGVYMAQTDYVLGGVPCPSVQVVSNLVDPAMTAEACGQKALEQMQKNGAKVDILSKGPAKLAKRDGFQFVIRKAAAPATQPSQTQPAEPATTLEVHRLLCVPPDEDEDEEQARNYVLIVAGRDVTERQLTDLADKLAGRFIVTTPREE